MKSASNPADVVWLGKHVALHCITDLRSAKTINTMLRKIYPNLKHVKIPSEETFKKVCAELQWLRMHSNVSLTEAMGGVHIWAPSTKNDWV